MRPAREDAEPGDRDADADQSDVLIVCTHRAEHRKAEQHADDEHALTHERCVRAALYERVDEEAADQYIGKCGDEPRNRGRRLPSETHRRETCARCNSAAT